MATAATGIFVNMDALEMAFFAAAHAAITKQVQAIYGLDLADSAQRAQLCALHDAVWDDIRFDVDEALGDRTSGWTMQSVVPLAEATVERLLKGCAWPPI